MSGAAIGEALPVGVLDVRLLRYQQDGYPGAARGTRVDLVTVEECASRGSATVVHSRWRLLGPDGRLLGKAGGKMVNGNPTEDLPRTLYAGQCQTVTLAVGVPAGATVVAVRDGADPAASWLVRD